MKYLIAENLLRQVVQISQMAKVVGILFVINTQYNYVSSLLYNKFNCSCCWRQFQIRKRNFRSFSIWRQVCKLAVVRGPRPSTFASGISTRIVGFLATNDVVTFHLKENKKLLCKPSMQVTKVSKNLFSSLLSMTAMFNLFNRQLYTENRRQIMCKSE